MAVKELEKIMEQLEKENTKIEKAQNRKKLLIQKQNKLKRNAETQRKIKKGGVFEAFEREITGMQEETENPDDENDKLDNQKEENLDEDLGADFLESED